MVTRPNAILRFLFLTPTYLYRLRCGWLFGHRFLLLIHVGRRTRLRRYTVLEILEFRRQPPEVIVMSAFGPKADWLRNIEATPGAEVVVVGSKCFAAVHRIVERDEAMAVIAAHERRKRFYAGVIRPVLSRILGWQYDGSEGARRQLVTQLPLIAFRPISKNDGAIGPGL
jgi:deazaflavin-dependent oxidoreductase (nitroreductase family)